MSAWQWAELMQIGPAGSPLMTTGGKSLRDEIYSWPTLNTCRVDQEIVTDRFGEAGYLDSILVTASGMAALEYLLFHASEANSCPPESAINTNGSWAALSAEERTLRRAEYAAAVAALVHAKAQALEAEWDPAAGNFLAQLSSAGESGSPFPTAQAALDEVFAAMFYVDLKVKDRKLAVPAGINPLCPRETCPEALESRLAAHSGTNVIENLRALRALFIGNAAGEPERQGFDDFLIARAAPEVAQTIVGDIDAAIALVEGIGDLEAALVQDPAPLHDAHAAVKRITDAMKSQMVTVLNLRVPQEGAADND